MATTFVLAFLTGSLVTEWKKSRVAEERAIGRNETADVSRRSRKRIWKCIKITFYLPFNYEANMNCTLHTILPIYQVQILQIDTKSKTVRIWHEKCYG